MARLGLVHQGGAIGGFDHVRHVAGGRDIGDGKGHAIGGQVEDFANQNARVQRDGLAGFEIDVDAVCRHGWI